jgi:diacylglycerol kinase
VILFNATDAVIALEELTANEALNTAIEPVCDTNK